MGSSRVALNSRISGFVLNRTPPQRSLSFLQNTAGMPSFAKQYAHSMVVHELHVLNTLRGQSHVRKIRINYDSIYLGIATHDKEAVRQQKRLVMPPCERHCLWRCL